MKEHLQRIFDELSRHGILPELTRTGSTHVRFAWSSPTGEPRQIFSAHTPSDWRGVLNQVALVRRLCKADGIIPLDKQKPLKDRVQTHEKGKVSVAPILAAIEAVMKQVEELFDYVTTPNYDDTKEPKDNAAPKRVSAVELLQYLSFTEWRSPASLARASGRKYTNVVAALQSLERKKLAVSYPHMGWRKVPVEVIKPAPVVLPFAKIRRKRLTAITDTQKPKTVLKREANAHAKPAHKNGTYHHNGVEKRKRGRPSKADLAARAAH